MINKSGWWFTESEWFFLNTEHQQWKLKLWYSNIHVELLFVFHQRKIIFSYKYHWWQPLYILKDNHIEISPKCQYISFFTIILLRDLSAFLFCITVSLQFKCWIKRDMCTQLCKTCLNMALKTSLFDKVKK